ncbi:MAG: phosphopantothenoylcysteine decarboxylase, partial [Salinirussus sp.]
ASGRTGRAVARACYIRGADVVLVHDGPDSSWATVERVESAEEMTDAVLDHASTADALVSAAAISDYTVETAQQKLRSGRDDLVIELEPTPKLVDEVRAAEPRLPIVGFKAETGGEDADLVEKGRDLLTRVDMPFVVANRAQVMGSAETRALLIRSDDVREFEGSKAELGDLVADELATVL